jgi:hypothetical protein
MRKYRVAVGLTRIIIGGTIIGLFVNVLSGTSIGSAAGVTFVLTVTHLWVFPIHFIISSFSRIITKLQPSTTELLWRISPIKWDDIILFPLPGLTGFLIEFAHFDSQLGQRGNR